MRKVDSNGVRNGGALGWRFVEEAILLNAWLIVDRGRGPPHSDPQEAITMKVGPVLYIGIVTVNRNNAERLVDRVVTNDNILREPGKVCVSASI
jgi:hypothetical protein